MDRERLGLERTHNGISAATHKEIECGDFVRLHLRPGAATQRPRRKPQLAPPLLAGAVLTLIGGVRIAVGRAPPPFRLALLRSDLLPVLRASSVFALGLSALLGLRRISLAIARSTRFPIPLPARGLDLLHAIRVGLDPGFRSGLRRFWIVVVIRPLLGVGKISRGQPRPMSLLDFAAPGGEVLSVFDSIPHLAFDDVWTKVVIAILLESLLAMLRVVTGDPRLPRRTAPPTFLRRPPARSRRLIACVRSIAFIARVSSSHRGTSEDAWGFCTSSVAGKWPLARSAILAR
ncbi:hypothetical protein D7I44_10320 [Gryllotalpicola protaetiae]|uniref:Uncharacterized protein n=1 Tax=Gryllotalpicola protaetiae TaxID=2419771 RepID=A0A387BS61_9MICO|nr:hypothetical protein D7I44_10320 [Gryllotalpicola protaetiae]